jgi:hypothetical protein
MASFAREAQNAVHASPYKRQMGEPAVGAVGRRWLRFPRPYNLFWYCDFETSSKIR